MSLNRDLVEFYIHYKLSQKGCPTEHLRFGDRSRDRDTERTQVDSQVDSQVETQVDSQVDSQVDLQVDSQVEITDGASLDSHFNGSVNGAGPDSAPWPRHRPGPAPDPAHLRSPAPPLDLDAVKEALCDSANEFELRFSRAFSDLHRQLHITPATAYHSFESVMDEVFRDGVNWGRVIGLFAFGGALAVECVDKEMQPLVDRIVDWMTVYLDEHIQDWIDSQGGWARFAQIYGDDAAAQTRRSEERFKKWLFAGMTLVTGVVVGSLLAQRRL